MTRNRRVRQQRIVQRRKQRLKDEVPKTEPTPNKVDSLPMTSLRDASIPALQRQKLASDIGQIQGNRHLQQLVSLQRSGDPAQEGAIASMQAKEQLLEHLSNELQGKPPKSKDAGQEAIKHVAKAALETKTGKQIQKKVKRFLLSKEGAPVSIMLGTAGVAAMIANNAEVPSIPVPLSDNMELTIDIEGPIAQPKGAMATFKLTF